jgi:alpha-L-fucosidase 2
MNLQGIWNEHLIPPWNSNYTVNINTEMNYWPTLMVDLPECTEPLRRLIAELAESGKRTAQAYYHAPGFTAHHNVDLWRMSTPVGAHRRGTAGFACWQMSAAWLCRHLWEQYEYTRDEEWLRQEGFPLIREAAAFCLSQLAEDEKGRLIIPAATSPENGFILEGHYRGKPYRIQRKPLGMYGVHIEYDYCYVRPDDCIDISTSKDSLYCYPTKKDVVTKISFATEELYKLKKVRQNV